MKRRSDNDPTDPLVGKIFTTSILLILVIILFVSIVKISKKYSFVKKGRNELREEIQETQASIDALTESLEYLDTPGGTQRALREQFRVASEGEELIIIVPSENES